MLYNDMFVDISIGEPQLILVVRKLFNAIMG